MPIPFLYALGGQAVRTGLRYIGRSVGSAAVQTARFASSAYRLSSMMGGGGGVQGHVRPPRLDVHVDVREVEKYLTRLERRAVPRAASRSLNRTANSTRTAARRKVAGEMGIAQKHIKRSFSVHKASQRRLQASIVAKGEPLDLYKFKGTRQTRRGVSSQAYGERKTYKGAFIATMPNGKMGVFVRKTRKSLPIRKMWGPSVPQTMVEDAAQTAMREKAGETWRKEFPRQLRYYIDREKKKASK